jgi:hypothetical protein
MAFCATQLKRDLGSSGVDLERHIFMYEDSKGGGIKDLPGSITTHRKKLEMVDIFIKVYLQKNKICFHKPFIVTQEVAGIEDVQLEVIKQLRGFKKRRKYKFDSDDQNVCQIIYTGKEPAGKNDDFVMALLIAVYHHKVFFTDPRYQRFWFGNSYY